MGGVAMNELVTVVVPVYNVIAYLEECIASILMQTYPSIEVILVDDGSSDGSGELCDLYSKKYSKIHVIHKENAGLGMARNTGIANSNGVYITFVDGDDYLSETHISELMRSIVNHKAEVVFGGYHQQLGERYIEIKNPKADCIYENQEIVNTFLPLMCGKLDYRVVDEIPMSVCMALYRKEIITKNNISFKSERDLISEDLIFNFDVLKHCSKICVSSSSGYFYRINTNSLTKKYQSDRLEKQIMFTRYVEKYVSELGVYNECEQRILSTFLSWVRNIVKSEQRNYTNVGVIESIKRIKSVCNNNFVIDAIKRYDNSKLTFKPRMMNYLIKFKMNLAIWISSYLKQ